MPRQLCLDALIYKAFLTMHGGGGNPPRFSGSREKLESVGNRIIHCSAYYQMPSVDWKVTGNCVATSV